MSDYKYLKYKNKYNNLKNSLKNNTYNMVNKKYINDSDKMLSLNMVGGTFQEKLDRLRSNDPTLTNMIVLGSNISDIGVYAFAETFALALAHNTTLIKLKLVASAIDDITIIPIANALTINNTLLYLEIYVPRVGNIGAEAIAEALKHNTTLKELILTIEMGDVGVQAIATALTINKTLISLELYGDNISDGAIALANALENNFTIHNFVGAVLFPVDIRERIETYLEENRHIKEKFEKIFIKTRQIMKSMGIRDMSRLPPELWRKIILEHFELSPREMNYYYFLENRPCPCRNRHCTGDAIEPCFIQNLYMKERSSGTVPAASEVD